MACNILPTALRQIYAKTSSTNLETGLKIIISVGRTLDSLINVMDGISVMVGKFGKILVKKYTPHQLISNLSAFFEFSSHI